MSISMAMIMTMTILGLVGSRTLIDVTNSHSA